MFVQLTEVYHGGKSVLCLSEHTFAVHGRGRCVCTHVDDLRVYVLRRLAYTRRCHPLLLLPPVAEPNTNHLLFQLQTVRQCGDLLRRRFRTFEEVALQGPFNAHLDGGALLALAALCRYFVDARRAASARIGLLQPLVQQRLELAHVLEAKLQCLEPADGGLRENIAVECAESQANVGLREAELNASLLELLGKLLEVVGGRCVLV